MKSQVKKRLPKWNRAIISMGMETLLLIIHLLIALALVGVILLQRSEGGALGIGGSGSGAGMGNMFSARGTANLLTRTTAILAVMFITTSLLLAIVSGRYNEENSSITEQLQQVPETSETNEPLVPFGQ